MLRVDMDDVSGNCIIVKLQLRLGDTCNGNYTLAKFLFKLYGTCNGNYTLAKFWIGPSMDVPSLASRRRHDDEHRPDVAAMA